jgi:hypothetical protein
MHVRQSGENAGPFRHPRVINAARRRLCSSAQPTYRRPEDLDQLATAHKALPLQGSAGTSLASHDRQTPQNLRVELMRWTFNDGTSVIVRLDACTANDNRHR